MFNGFSHSVKGASHKASGTVCQDSSAYLAEERYAVAVVADGHGSKKHFRSNIGSERLLMHTMQKHAYFQYKSCQTLTLHYCCILMTLYLPDLILHNL